MELQKIIERLKLKRRKLITKAELIEDGIDLDKRPILSFLLNENIMGLFDFAKDLGYRGLEEGYVSKCHLCLDLRKYFISQKDFEELRPLEFYDHL